MKLINKRITTLIILMFLVFNNVFINTVYACPVAFLYYLTKVTHDLRMKQVKDIIKHFRAMASTQKETQDAFSMLDIKMNPSAYSNINQKIAENLLELLYPTKVLLTGPEINKILKYALQKGSVKNEPLDEDLLQTLLTDLKLTE